MSTLEPIVNTYNHLMVRVEYPRESGHRMECEPLRPWMHITVTNDGESKWLTVHSRIHKNKAVKVGPSYSLEFTDQEIIKDLSGDVKHRFY